MDRILAAFSSVRFSPKTLRLLKNGDTRACEIFKLFCPVLGKHVQNTLHILSIHYKLELVFRERTSNLGLLHPIGGYYG